MTETIFDIDLPILGEDGNAFMILGIAVSLAKTHGIAKEQVDEFVNEATEGDYNHLLATCMKYFNVTEKNSD